MNKLKELPFETYLLDYGVPLLKAIIILIVGFMAIKWVSKAIRKSLTIKATDPSLITFIISLVSSGLKVLLIITVAGIVGIPMTSFVAIIGAAGLAVGLALQGTLANFAGGVLILLFKPYKVGDLVECQGVKGVVKEIQIVNTILTTGDNRMIFIPNGAIMNGNITNFTMVGVMRVDMQIGISYTADIAKAKEILLDVLTNNPLVLKDPAPVVNVASLGDSAVVLNVRPYCLPDDYWTILAQTLEEAKNSLDNGGIGIPFPQMDVHIKNN